MREEERKFKEGLLKLGKECGLDHSETIRTIKLVAQSLEPENFSRRKTGKHPSLLCDKELPEEIERKFIDFHFKIVQEILDFINDTPEIKNLIPKLKEERKDPLGFDPMTNFYLSLTDLEESIEAKEWVPSMDSGMIIDIGGQTLIESL
jgi:hypothetical protein